jgi:hypothetical protein
MRRTCRFDGSACTDLRLSKYGRLLEASETTHLTYRGQLVGREWFVPQGHSLGVGFGINSLMPKFVCGTSHMTIGRGRFIRIIPSGRVSMVRDAQCFRRFLQQCYGWYSISFHSTLGRRNVPGAT